jgi:hypothetical protein
MTDTTVHKTVEETEHGYRLKVESTRGTGTRDQDKVRAELRTEERPDLADQAAVVADVIEHMDTLRRYDPDEEADDE